MSDLAALRSAILLVFPESSCYPLTKTELDAIQWEYPNIPQHYLMFLQQVGFGMIGGFMLYGDPVLPDAIFDPDTAARLTDLLLIGDNVAGSMLGFDTQRWRLVVLDDHTLEVEAVDARTLEEFFAHRVAEADEGDSIDWVL